MGTRKILLNTSFSIVEKMWKAKDLNHASKRNSLKHKKVLYYNSELQLAGGWDNIGLCLDFIQKIVIILWVLRALMFNSQILFHKINS